MEYCDLTLPTPEANLALDEALLETCEAGRCDEVLRIWEPTDFFVVVGYANRVATEVKLPECQQLGIPVHRRCTGGGTVLQGPGCLNYSLVLRIEPSGPLAGITATNDFVLGHIQVALSDLLNRPVEKQGHTDLALAGLKFSGNAQRRQKQFLLFHGSLLLGMDLELIERVLPMPSKAPAYRANRRHRDFLVNLNVPPTAVREAFVKAWGAIQGLSTVPLEQTSRLVCEKYRLEEWNRKF